MLLLPAAALCSRAPCPSARRQPQQQQRRWRQLLQAPRRRLHIARHAAGRAPSCLPRLLPLTGPAAPRPGLPAAPPLPAPCRRLTRAGTCSPRPRRIRRLVGLLSGAQVTPAALTPALPLTQGRWRVPPVEAAGSSLRIREAPRHGHAPGLASTAGCGPAPSTLATGRGLAHLGAPPRRSLFLTSDHGPAPSLDLIWVSGPTPSLVLTSGHGTAPVLALTFGLGLFSRVSWTSVLSTPLTWSPRGLGTFLQDRWPIPERDSQSWNLGLGPLKS